MGERRETVLVSQVYPSLQEVSARGGVGDRFSLGMNSPDMYLAFGALFATHGAL